MKLFTKCLWAGLLVLVGGVVPGGAETFQVVQDTYATGGMISKAAGGAPNLPVDATHTAFIQFDLSAVSFTASQVVGARLVIYFPTATAGGSLQFFANSSGFSEILTAPATAPTQFATPLGTLAVTPAAKKNFAVTDVTSEVKAWLAGATTNFGFAIKATQGAKVTIGAKEGSSTGYPAVLEVDVNLLSGPISGTDATFSGNVAVGGTNANPSSHLNINTPGQMNVTMSLQGRTSDTTILKLLDASGTAVTAFTTDGSITTALDFEAQRDIIADRNLLATNGVLSAARGNFNGNINVTGGRLTVLPSIAANPSVTLSSNGVSAFLVDASAVTVAGKNVVVGEETVPMRIIRGGIIGATGSVSKGTGFSVLRNSAGFYVITFDTPFTATPTVTCTVNSGFQLIGVFDLSTSSVLVGIANPGATATVDANFDFIAMGAR